jgi:hypothetical protein
MLVGGTSLSLSPKPMIPPVEITTWTIFPEPASMTKSWIFPSSFPSESRRRFPLYFVIVMASASSLARLTSSLAVEPATFCGELCAALLDAVDPVDDPAEAALDGFDKASSVRVASLVVAWPLVGSVVGLVLEEDGAWPCRLVPLVTCADSDGAAHSAIALSAAMMLIR